jgi:hypothetical protein
MSREITWQLVRGKAAWYKPNTWTSPIIGYWGAGFYSHIDVVTPDGFLRGARSDVITVGNWKIPAGYQDRPQGYESWSAQTRYTLSVSDEQYEKYWNYSDKHLGDPYDERGLVMAFIFGRKHTVKDPRNKWVGWCSQEVSMNGQDAGIWAIPPEVHDVDPGDCAFLFAGRNARRAEMIPLPA